MKHEIVLKSNNPGDPFQFTAVYTRDGEPVSQTYVNAVDDARFWGESVLRQAREMNAKPVILLSEEF